MNGFEQKTKEQVLEILKEHKDLARKEADNGESVETNEARWQVYCEAILLVENIK